MTVKGSRPATAQFLGLAQSLSQITTLANVYVGPFLVMLLTQNGPAEVTAVSVALARF